MARDHRLKLESEQRKRIVAELRAFLHREWDKEVGELAAGLLLDQIGERLGPIYYNRGVRDAVALISDRLEDLYALEIRDSATGGRR